MYKLMDSRYKLSEYIHIYKSKFIWISDTNITAHR